MKSAMKSAFAIIAVALMIMVAVVPMVGVFTDDSEAATIVPDTTKSLTVSGTVMDSDTQKIKDVLVKVANGDYKEYGLTGSDGKYTITVNYSGTSIATLKVEIVTTSDEYTAMTGNTTNPVEGKFTEGNSQTISSVTGNVSGIDFMSGYVTISGKLTYANTAVAYDQTVSTITATTVVTEGTGTSYPGSFDAKTGIYTILVPINAGKVTISAGENFATKEVTVTKANVTSGTDLANKNTYKISVTFSNVFGDNTINVSAPEGSKITSPTLGTAIKNVYPLTYVLGTEGTTKDVVFKDTKGYMWDNTQAVGTSNITLTEDAYVTGSIKMSSLAIPGTNTVTADSVKFYKDSTDTGKTGTFTQIADGKYVIALSKIDGLKDAGANKVKFTATVANTTVNNVAVTEDMDISISLTGANTGRDITFDKTGYYLISGTVKNGTTGVAGIELTITTNNAVGLVENKVTTDSTGKYSFYAKSGESVTIATPTTTGEAKYTPSSQTFVAIADKTVDFTMDSQKLTSGVIKDAADTPVALKGVTVKYRVGTTGTFSDATFDDTTSKYSVTVPLSVSMNDIQVYFTKAGYTFSSEDKLITADNPTTMSNSDVQANEQTLTFKVTDAAGKAIKLAEEENLKFGYAEYKIHAVGSGINAFDGTVPTESNVTYDATTGVYSFIAKKLDSSTADYRTQYGINTITNTSKYTFATITEFTDGMTIKANEYTLTGFVKDAAGDKAISGVTVSSTKDSTGVSTNEKGYFEILVTASEDVITATNKNPYTFSTDGVKVAGETEITIKANEQTYTGTLKDADGKAITGTTYTVKVTNASGTVGAETTTIDENGGFTIVTAVKEGYKLVVTDSTGSNGRTFESVTLKGTETTLDAVSGQATYSGKVYLADGTTIIMNVSVKAYKTSATAADVQVGATATTGKDGSYTILLPVADDKSYVVKASSTYATLKFSDEGVAFDNYVADIISTTKVTDTGVGTLVSLKDANNVALDAGYTVSVYDVKDASAKKDYKLVGTFTTDDKGQFKYLGTAGEEYKFYVVAPSGSLHTFGTDGYVSADGSSVINANEQTYEGTLKSANNVAIPGAVISFLDAKGKVLTTATTDANGAWEAVYGSAVAKKVASTSTYGAITVSEETLATVALTASEYIYSGLYAKGDVVSGVVVTYEIKDDTAKVFYEMGKATVVDNKFYVVAKTQLTGNVKITVTASASNYYAVGTYASSATNMNLDISKKAGIVNVDVTDELFGDYYQVYNATNAQVGDKIILRATNVAYAPLEDNNSTTVVKYTFNGWYVNGVKVSDDLEYTYTVTEECVVYADYKVSSYETEPSQGVDSTVLIIGIAAVIIALFAVIYAVIQKRE